MNKQDVDNYFLQSANKALQIHGFSALEFLSAFPNKSDLELAKQLNHGANAYGLTAALYFEAKQVRAVRSLAYELLVRSINSTFPSGWPEDYKPSPSVSLAFWLSYIRGNAPEHYDQAFSILKEIAVTNPPPPGWRPQRTSDPLINSLFDKHWTE